MIDVDNEAFDFLGEMAGAYLDDAGIFWGSNKCLIVTFTWTAKKTHGPD